LAGLEPQAVGDSPHFASSQGTPPAGTLRLERILIGHLWACAPFAMAWAVWPDRFGHTADASEIHGMRLLYIAAAVSLAIRTFQVCFRQGLGWTLYLWPLLDIALIACGIAVTKPGPDSWVVLLFALPIAQGAVAGEGAIYPTLAPRVLSEFRRLAGRPQGQREIYQVLSRREVEVLELITKGMRNKQIADALSLSKRTVKNHRGAILQKLHANDRVEAAEIAREKGLGD
jgi:DNA-binding CsgD family transcriptional regulator